MIAVDASAVVDKLAFRGVGSRVERHLERSQAICAPDLLYAEVASALARLVLAGILTSEQGGVAIDDLRDLPVVVVPHRDLVKRAWGLRESVRIPDGFYLACGEVMQAPVLTTDRRLALGHHGVPVILVT